VFLETDFAGRTFDRRVVIEFKNIFVEVEFRVFHGPCAFLAAVRTLADVILDAT